MRLGQNATGSISCGEFMSEIVTNDLMILLTHRWEAATIAADKVKVLLISQGSNIEWAHSMGKRVYSLSLISPQMDLSYINIEVHPPKLAVSRVAGTGLWRALCFQKPRRAAP